MANPIVRQHNPRQIRMIEEADAVEIEHLALIPVCRTIHRKSRLDLGIVAGYPGFQSEPLLSRNRLQVINDLEPRLGGIAVDPGHSAQAFKVQLVS